MPLMTLPSSNHTRYEPSHSRGAPEVPELLTLGTQYLPAKNTWKKFDRASRPALVCASPKTNIRAKFSSSLVVPHFTQLVRNLCPTKYNPYRGVTRISKRPHHRIIFSFDDAPIKQPYRTTTHEHHRISFSSRHANRSSASYTRYQVYHNSPPHQSVALYGAPISTISYIFPRTTLPPHQLLLITTRR